MADPSSARVPAWSPVPWSTLPAEFREGPEQWPRPQRRTRAEIFWWRAAVIIVGFAFLAVHVLPTPSRNSWLTELTGLQAVALWSALLLTVFYEAVYVVAIARPHFPRSSQVDEMSRRIRTARRETLRALRRNERIPPEREPLARLWIVHDRAETWRLAQMGLLTALLLMVSADRPSWKTVAVLIGAVVWLGVAVETLRRERAARRWIEVR